MKKGQRVNTPHGPGTVEDVEAYSRIYDKRFGVKLDSGPLFGWISIPYYWTNELSQIETK